MFRFRETEREPITPTTLRAIAALTIVEALFFLQRKFNATEIHRKVEKVREREREREE